MGELSVLYICNFSVSLKLFQKKDFIIEEKNIFNSILVITSLDLYYL